VAPKVPRLENVNIPIYESVWTERWQGIVIQRDMSHRGADWNDVNMTVGVGRMAAGNHKARRQGRVRGESVSERHLPDATRDAAYDEWVKQVRELCRQAEEEHGDLVESCVVLDPFIGSGTTAVVCVGLGRYSMGIDLSEEYLKKNAIPRIEGELLGRPALANLVPR
jgi:hypothetical protein